MDSFNTASVLIQRECVSMLGECIMFQYSFCSYSTLKQVRRKHKIRCFNTASVLIQLHSVSIGNADIMFQYSFCSYSTKSYSAGVSSGYSFNTASVLIQLDSYDLRYCGSIMFQYSFCSYSTACICPWHRGVCVSIQLLFLFNIRKN